MRKTVKGRHFDRLYNLVCIAPDGSRVIDQRKQPYAACVKASEEMGSKWIFYPFHVITTEGNAMIADAFGDMEPYIGKRLTTLTHAVRSGTFNYMLEP